MTEKHPTSYPSAEDIKKYKEQEKAAGRRRGCLAPLIFLLLVVGVFAVAMSNRQPARLEVAAVPPTAILASETWPPTPTLAPTATATPALALAIEEQPTQEPATWTLEPTHTPLPTLTPWPTHTPLPSATWTLEPTHTPLPTLTPWPTHTAVPPAPTSPPAIAHVEPTTAPGPSLPVLVQDLDDTRSELQTALFVVLALLFVALLLVGYSLRSLSPGAILALLMRKQGPDPGQPGGAPAGTVPAGITPDGEVVPLSPTAVALPRPTWQPVREASAPVHAPVTPVSPPNAPVQNTGAGPETITVALQPTGQGDEETMRDICRIWNNLERPSFNKVCEAKFGSKNSERLAIVRRSIKWGRGQGLVKNQDGTWPTAVNGQPKREQPVQRRRGIRQRPPRPNGVRRIVQ